LQKFPVARIGIELATDHEELHRPHLLLEGGGGFEEIRMALEAVQIADGADQGAVGGDAQLEPGAAALGGIVRLGHEQTRVHGGVEHGCFVPQSRIALRA
jgi:hypothetical protein